MPTQSIRCIILLVRKHRQAPVEKYSQGCFILYERRDFVADIKRKMFDEGQLETLCKIIADTNDGLTGSQIEYFLRATKIADTDPTFSFHIEIPCPI